MMKWSMAIMLVLISLPACRGYDLRSRLVDRDGSVPADQYARYGREQAQEIAIGREFAQEPNGSSPDQRIGQAEAAVAYARTLPDVADVKADPLGFVLTVRFKSGWRTMVTPIADGKRGAETVGLPSQSGRGATR
jgi:hypothetical protein